MLQQKLGQLSKRFANACVVTRSRAPHTSSGPKVIEAELHLAELCAVIDDLGERDTFPFEERIFLRTAIKGIMTNDADATRRMLTPPQEFGVARQGRKPGAMGGGRGRT